MKCIIKAMNENSKPKKRWWGFVVGDKRYLCRYNHCFAIFQKGKVLKIEYQTITDKRGVEFAVKYYKQQLKSKT